jgi:catechol 2,3-dioxygenase-like lactoylglutathione lyase family enzyme
MKIKLTTIYVDDQDKALRFYTEVLGFKKKTDVTASTIAQVNDTVGNLVQITQLNW